MKFKVITTFLDKPLKGSTVDKSLLNTKARRHWNKNSDEVISRGMKFAEQANRLLPDNASLRVYYEGETLPKNMDKVEFVEHPIHKVQEFKRKADGRVVPKLFEKYDYNEWKKRINFETGYVYEYDAIRFCHPPIALIEAHNTVDERYIISIDADVYNDWWNEYKLLYESDKLFDIYDGWTDCHAFEYVNDKINEKHNINSYIIKSHQSHNVWEVSPLQKYMSHYKGTAIPV